jgi:aldehyde dehydrogenase (NAD+)
MSPSRRTEPPVRNPHAFFIGGKWVDPSSTATIDVIDSATEELFFTVAEARETDMNRAVAAARMAFDDGPWPQFTHHQRADYLREFAKEMRNHADVLADIWPRESGVLSAIAAGTSAIIPSLFDFYADLAETYPFEERVQLTMGGELGLLVREPTGVVGAIIPWNVPLTLAAYKIAPALLAGCTIVLKSSPEAPGAGYILGEIAENIGLPPGVLNVLTADREVSELLVRDSRVDKIAFTGSTAAGRRIASICGNRIARFTLELGGKSAAVVLDDFDLAEAATTIAGAECFLSGQVCSSLTRIIVTRNRHDELVEALSNIFSMVAVGDPFDPQSAMGPLATGRQRDRVERYIGIGLSEGAQLATGGGRPKHLPKGFYVEPTVFGNVDNSSTIAREEIFGPVLSVIAADTEAQAVELANDTIYGLNASIFTNDVERASVIAKQLRSGTVAHNRFASQLGMASGGFKQSGVGREGGVEGMLAYLETKSIILDGTPERYVSP